MNLPALSHAVAWCWTIIGTQAFREWSVVAAEIVVAWVIYRELAETRNSAFLHKATIFKTNRDRATIYSEFFALPMTFNTVDEASSGFHRNALNNPKVHKACMRQLALFNELGIVYRKTFWVFRNRLVTVLPHAAIYMWIFYRHHVKERRGDSGVWFAAPMLRFTYESVKYALKFNQHLCLRPQTGQSSTKELRISVHDLELLRDELKVEIKKSKVPGLFAKRRWTKNPLGN